MKDLPNLESDHPDALCSSRVRPHKSTLLLTVLPTGTGVSHRHEDPARFPAIVDREWQDHGYEEHHIP